MADTEFAKGIYPKAPHPNAPDVVKAMLRLKLEDAIEFLEAKRAAGSECLDLDIKESQGGNWYASVNTWQDNGKSPSPNQSPSLATAPDVSSEEDWGDIPF